MFIPTLTHIHPCTNIFSDYPLACTASFSTFMNYSPDRSQSYNQFAGSLDQCKNACYSTNCTSFTYIAFSLSCYLFQGKEYSIKFEGGSGLYIRQYCIPDLKSPTTGKNCDYND